MRTADGYIISKCLNGDSAAFGLLVDKYKGSVYALAYSKLRNFHDAEDVTQEVFIKAYRKLRTLKQYDSFHAWLYAATSNLCKDWLKALSRRPDNEFIEDKDPETLEAPSIDSYRESLFHESLYESLHEALDSMPEAHSQVLTLRYLGGMSCKEIARFLGVSPTAIWQRLSRARAQLKEEMIAMINTNFERQKLQASFTLRIVDAIKRIRIQPVPRATGLPWCLSLATGIALAILRFSPYPGILNRAVTGSALPGETKVLKIGEIPVDILNVSRISTLASEQRDNGQHESSGSQNVTLAAAQDEGDTHEQKASTDEGVIIDPETGAEYTRIKTLLGKSDVIDIDYAGLSLSLSPNGKFLLWRKLVVPLDGREPFDLVDMYTLNSSWSPDGKKVAFYSSGAIWVIPVSPETGQSTGPAKKLLDGGHYGFSVCGNPSWSPDSERIVFEWRDKEKQGDIWTLSVEDGALTRITDDSGHDPIWSPDGKTIAYRMDRKEERETWLVPAEGGTPRKISTGKVGDYRPSWCNWYWSPDSQWLVGYTLSWERLRFFRLADGREFDVTTKEVGYHFGWSPDGEKMLFYRSSYDPKSALKVVSVAGGPSFEPGSRLTLWPWKQSWSPDSRMIVADGEDKDGAEGWYGLWVIPVAGGDPFLLELDVSVPGELAPWDWYPSPDCGKLFFSVKRSDNGKDLWVVPISLKDGRTTGPAVMVFGAWEGRTPIPWEWSPDGTKLAVIHKRDIWVASADGGEPVQITRTPEDKSWPQWSPDGKMIAYTSGALMVVPASGGEATKILDITGRAVGYAGYAWSPDSKELAVLSSNRWYRKEGVILAISIPDGKTRQILDLSEQPVDDARYLRWSPDGQNLALTGSNYLTIVDSKPRNQIFIVPAEGGKVTGIAADYSGGMGDNYGPISWSPDGKWISYQCNGYAKTRPEGEIWEVDFQDLLSSGSYEH
jgi:RNA polymerase sigma factor (sigma-70 family)